MALQQFECLAQILDCYKIDTTRVFELWAFGSWARPSAIFYLSISYDLGQKHLLFWNKWLVKKMVKNHALYRVTNINNKYFFAKASPFQVRFFWVALYGNMPLFYNSVCGQCFSIGNTKKRSLISRDISLHGLHACFFMETLHTYGSLTRKLSLICIHRRKLSSLFQSWMGVVVITWTKFHCVIEWPMINELKRLGRNLRGKYFFPRSSLFWFSPL